MINTKPTDSESIRQLMQAAFNALRPIVRLLRSTGLEDRDLHRAFDRAVFECNGESPCGINVDLEVFE